MKDINDKESLAECYICAENNGTFCKLCKESFCIVDHEEHLEAMRNNGEYLDYHTYYQMEFLGVKH